MGTLSGGRGACRALLVASSVLAAGAGPAMAQLLEPTIPPVPPAFPAQSVPIMVEGSDIETFRALPEYHEPDWVTADFVAKGLLPPVAERLPKEPLVFNAANMPDGIGVYGDVMRHVTGGRPEGWNYMVGQSQGWGGVDIATMECLTRTGPLFTVKAENLEPLPNLAKSWEWSSDGHTLTMHLVEGAKWSDGAPFTSEDVMFYWEDHVLDPNLTPLSGAGPDSFGIGTGLKAIDDFTIEWTFTTAFPTNYLYEMAYGNFCPGPAHILKPLHPRYNSATDYNAYRNAIPAEFMNFPVLGAWVPVVYRPDDVLILRRNPYYWKVDEAGNQLPYFDEMQYRLSTWAARDIEVAAGGSDFSNLEQTENYVEALRHAADPAAAARLDFGPRTIAFSLLLNLSANGWGAPDARAQAVRELNRTLGFRQAVTSAIDRARLGQALVKGEFTAIYPGGLQVGSTYYDRDSTSYYPPSVETAKAYLAAAGLADSDSDGWVNWPAGTLDGGNVIVEVLVISDSNVFRTLGDGILAQLEAIGLRIVLRVVQSDEAVAIWHAGQFDWVIARNNQELATVMQGITQLAPIGPNVHEFHQAGTDGTLDLMPFEEELVGIVHRFIANPDPLARLQLMRDYQRIYTSNVYAIGLTQFPGALMVSKRLANVPPGAPIFLFNWAEDSIIRERVFVPEERQSDFELLPRTLPGPPGSAGPVSGG